jgi:hypothetical protein
LRGPRDSIHYLSDAVAILERRYIGTKVPLLSDSGYYLVDLEGEAVAPSYWMRSLQANREKEIAERVVGPQRH